MKKNYNLVATNAAGIEAIVSRELKDLGIENSIDANSRVLFSGDQAIIAKANLWLRTADRIKIIVAEFEANTFEELFQNVQAIEWGDFIPLGHAFPITKAKSVKSTLHNEPSIQAITKKAVVKKLQKIYHRPDGVPLIETGPLVPIEVSVHKNKVTIMIDTSGESLFKRGYRAEKGGAPIKENMAAAIIMLTNWRVNMKRPFVDPTCGSGTFPIEAAMIARNIAPGLNRDFICETWSWFDSKSFEAERENAKEAIDYDIDLDISGFDIDGRMIEIAQENAKKAGVFEDIEFKQMRLQDFRTEKEDGVLISNPPYGERLLKFEDVKILYKEMGEVLRPLTTWSKYILTSDLMFEEKYGAKATKKRKLYNGTLRVDLYQYFGKRK